ncbi:MAG: DUF4173 domain-containing protein [Patescibacteria group bacterium]
MKHLPWKLLVSAVFLGLAFDMLFFNINKLGVNVLVMQLLLIGVVYGLAKWQKITIPINAWLSASFALAFAATFAICTSEIGLSLSALGLFVANFYCALFFLGHHTKFHHPFNAVAAAFVDLASPILNRLNILAHLKLPGKTDKSTEIVRGILIAVPILIVFALLFLSSDLVLQNQTENFLTNFDEWLQNGKIIGHTVVVLLVSAAFLGFFAATFWRRPEIKLPSALNLKHHIESAVILGGSILLFLGFILFQSYYLFGGQAAWNNIEGITYSEYAVQGFNELATVAALVILLILSLRYFHSERPGKLIKILETVLLCETVLVIISAWMRMSLYVEQYGFTTARLFGFWFFIVAFVLLGMFTYNILREREQYKFMHQALIFCGVSMLLFTASAPDALSVRLNLARHSEEIPFSAFPLFDDLSAEAYPLMNHVLTQEPEMIGLMETTITDYCPFVRAHASNGVIRSFTLIDDPSIDKQLSDDFWLRRDIASFTNHWNKQFFTYSYVDANGKRASNRRASIDGKGTIYKMRYIKNNPWQSWNLSRARLPHPETYEEIEERGIPYPADMIANACGMYLGDQR